ncbi:cobalamin binding intrinsic factor-like isoform X2 [Pristis pectinata]|uniref:cobalamin binding intrinsic factor-like isoform X2 n=1 Tax=Pristis pectinata TaxID=685728 RepID=UPI00223E7365|nr:cobalamin binding intrinsic factor-like isoform X2 [Pristis pectinata]
MGQEPVLLTVLVAICLSSAGSGTQQLPPISRPSDTPSPDAVIEKLLRELRESASSTDPDPRTLLALRLASEAPSEAEEIILRGLKEQTAWNGENLSTGMAALYVLAMMASGVDPSNVSDPPTHGPPVNLLEILRVQMDAEFKSLELHGHPRTTYYQVALGLLGLCKGRVPITKTHLRNFTDAVRGEGWFVDTEAVSALALRCLRDRGAKPQEPVRAALERLIRRLRSALTDQGTIGNIYSTGLAMQAFIGNDIPPTAWNSTGVRREVFAQAERGAFRIPISAAQVLPPLLWKSYLDVVCTQCPGNVWDPLPRQHAPASDPGSRCPPATGDQAQMLVTYTVVRAVYCSQDCWHFIPLAVPEGATILEAMCKAERERPHFFKFTQTLTTWGPYITSIGGTEVNSQKRTYWQFLIGTQPIPVGVAEYKLSDGDHIFAKYTTY